MEAQQLAVIALVDIDNVEFAKNYQLGLQYTMHWERESNGLIEDQYVISNLTMCVKNGWFDGQHQTTLYQHVGFTLGMVHGSIVSPHTGKLFPDATTLVKLHNTEFLRGYQAGREWYFLDTPPDERRRADTDIIRYLQEVAADLLHSKNGEVIWNFGIGCLIGELSGQLFPCTQEEIHAWEAEYIELPTEGQRGVVEHQFLQQS